MSTMVAGSSRHPQPSSVVVRFLGVTLIVLGVGGLLGRWFVSWITPPIVQPPAPAAGFVCPRAFLWSSLTLLLGSLFLQRALNWVRRERQREFRNSLLWGLLLGTLFVGLQSAGLWDMLRYNRPAEASTSDHAFIFVFAAMHGMHFLLALLFLCFITVRALADWYDHEYYWGVLLCTYFWHLLGLAWLAILGIILVATQL